MPRQPRWRPRVGWLVLLGLLLPGLLLLGLVAVAVPLTTATASAGRGLVKADPADGAALPAAPTAVTLTFATPPDPSRSHMSVADPAGNFVSTAEVIRTDASVVRLPVSIHTPGDYTVAFHAVLTDGSAQTGVLRFSVGTGAPPAGTDPAPATDHQHTIDPFSAALLVVDLAVLLAVVVLLFRPRRPDMSASPR